jgi:hypothetical protein
MGIILNKSRHDGFIEDKDTLYRILHDDLKSDLARYRDKQ